MLRFLSDHIDAPLQSSRVDSTGDIGHRITPSIDEESGGKTADTLGDGRIQIHIKEHREGIAIGLDQGFRILLGVVAVAGDIHH